MNIILACEESQAVCIEMRKRGHSAWSCDTLDCSGGHPEWHICGDVLQFLGPNKYNNFEGWGMLIGFPPCTHLTSAGATHWHIKREDGRQQEGIDFFMSLANAEIPCICLENPTGIITRAWRPPDQSIHPYYFGDPYLKRTCLWLKGLGPLVHFERDNIFSKKTHIEPTHYWNNSGMHNKKGARFKTPGLHRDSKMRSKTFPGIARAMAEQWG